MKKPKTWVLTDEKRKIWIEKRNDTNQLNGPSSIYGVQRLNEPELKRLRYAEPPKPRVAKSGKNVSQMHYAREGIITSEMEFIAIRENQRVREYEDNEEMGGGFFKTMEEAEARVREYQHSN